MSTTNVSGLCECGCGQPTRLARQTNRDRGWVKGQPIRFVKGHSGHKYREGERLGDRWRIEDRGFRTPCWTWMLAKNHNGYGILMSGTRCAQVAHRYHYEQRHGSLPRHVHLDHLCRHRDCVNPDHLEPVSNAENSRRGANAKLDYGQVQEIRHLLRQGWLQADIGDAYGVSGASISYVNTGKTWTDR